MSPSTSRRINLHTDDGQGGSLAETNRSMVTKNKTRTAIMNIQEKETFKNRTLTQIALNTAIRYFMDFAYNSLQDMWQMKKDGTFYKQTQDKIDTYIKLILECTSDHMAKVYGADIKGLNAYVGNGYKGPGNNQKFNFRVSASYCDTTGNEPQWLTQGNYMYVGKQAPEWLNADEYEENNKKYIQDQKDKYPIVSVKDAMTAQRHYMKLKKAIDDARQARRDFAYNFGSEYLTNNI